MDTKFLSPEPANGRPREIGTLTAYDGRHGFFLGYDGGVRYLLDVKIADKLVKAIDADYKVEVIFHRKKEIKIFEKIKIKILEKIQKSLQPA